MFLIGFLFSHGTSSFFRLWERAAALLAVAPRLPTSKDRRGCQRWAQPIHLPLTGSTGFANYPIQCCRLPMFNSVIQKQIFLQ